MKKAAAYILATVSGLYLLIWGPIMGPLDPIPLVDEGLALLIFVKSMAALGIDVSRFVPFLGGRRSKETQARKSKSDKKEGPIIDV